MRPLAASRYPAGVLFRSAVAHHSALTASPVAAVEHQKVADGVAMPPK